MTMRTIVQRKSDETWENSSHSHARILPCPGCQDILFLDSWKPMEFLLASPSLESAQNFKNRLAGWDK